MAKKLFLLLFLLILAESVSAALIHGSVYDISLDKMVDVRLEIDTTPKQTYVSKDGDYEFSVPVGEYTIKASYYRGSFLEASVEEQVSVQDEGTYVLDLILFPNLDEESQLIDESDDIDPGVVLDEKDYTLYFWIGAVILLLIIFYLIKKRKKPVKKEEEKEEPEEAKEPKETKADLDKLIDIIKQEGGRATQKEIRKHFPLSEAKMSLMIAELEHKGVVKKIKKGRGNIIILNE